MMRSASAKALRILQDTETLYRNLFQESNDGIILHDLEGRILDANRKIQELLGYDLESFLRTSLPALHPPDQLDRARGALKKISESRGVRFEIDFLCRDGRIFPAEVSASLLELGDRALVQGMVRDISERREAEANLRRSEERKSAMLATALDCIVTVDPEGTIVEFNPAAEATFGYSREEALGQPMAELLIPEEMRQAHHDALRRYLETGETRVLGRRLELEALRRDGRRLLVEVSIARLPTSSGRPLFTGYMRDITDRKRAEEEMRRARDAAEEANRAKSDFLASMSHELRTPLNVISGMSELALDSEVDGELWDYLEAIDSSSRALLALINDLLDISRIEAGHLELEPQPVELRPLVDELCRPLKHRAESKGLVLRWTVERSVPAVLHLDPHRLRQVLLNLLSNAIKFTEVGSVSLDASVQPLEGGGAELRIVVADTGVGFDVALSEKIFDRFTQLRSTSRGRPGGTGLGLAISRALVELMGGRLEAESAPGQGAVFRFCLRLSRGPAATLEASPAALSPRSVAPRIPPSEQRVLLVDDHAANRCVAARFLEQGGYEVEQAASGEEAILKLAAGPPFRLVLMDVEMPELDGFETTLRIRSSPGLEEVPIVALTAHAVSGFRQRCLEAGMQDYLVKPVRKASLLEAVDLWMQPSARLLAEGAVRLSALGETAAGGEPPRRVDPSPPSPPSVPASLASDPILLELDPDVADLVPGFLERCRAMVSELRFLEPSDHEGARRLGHNLKGSGAAYGLPEISRLGAEIERRARAGEAAEWKVVTDRLGDYLGRIRLPDPY